MKEIIIITGSTLGSAEYVGEHLEELLNDQGFKTTLYHGPDLTELPLSGIWLVVVSTHGAGELPDNIKPLFDQIESSNSDFSHINFATVGLGNSEYDMFCGAVKKVNNILVHKKANKLLSALEIDIKDYPVPEEKAEEWLTNLIKLLK